MKANREEENTSLTIIFITFAVTKQEIQNFYKKEPYLCVLKRKILT